jgi:peroxiredoxin
MAATPSTMLDLGTKAPDFHLPDYDGHIHALQDHLGEKGTIIIFICNHCPYVVHIIQRFSELSSEFMKKGMGVVAISSNDVDAYPQDAPPEMKKFAEKYGFEFPYLFDQKQDIAQNYRAACTPDIYLFDENRKLIYRGQFDDSRPGNDLPVTGNDLQNAVEAMLNGEEVSAEQKPSMGCNIKWKKGNEPDYFG